LTVNAAVTSFITCVAHALVCTDSDMYALCEQRIAIVFFVNTNVNLGTAELARPCVLAIARESVDEVDGEPENERDMEGADSRGGGCLPPQSQSHDGQEGEGGG
jgi:hypothetical protein